MRERQQTREATPRFFNLHIHGIGYLDRVREVKPKRGQPFLAVDVTALHGHPDEVSRTRFQCIVRGREAARVVQAARRHLEAGRKVLAGFRLGDLYAEPYIRDRDGEPAVALKARLLFISWVKVDGRTVYRAQAREADQPQAAAS